MIEGTFIISLVGLLAVPLMAFVLLKGTLFDITNLRNNPWPLLWYFMLLLVLLPLVIVSALGIDNIPLLYVAQPGTEGQIAFIVISSLVGYIIILSFSCRLFKLRNPKANLSISSLSKLKSLAGALSQLGILTITIFLLLGYRHAFLMALLFDESLIKVRLANKYLSIIPSQIASIILPLGYILAALAGYIGRFKLILSLKYLAIALFLLSAPGDKAPPLWGIAIWAIAQGSFLHRTVFSLKSILLLSFLVIGILTLTYFVYSVQQPNSNSVDFGRYLLGRLGVGQMGGVYETFGLIQNGLMPKGKFYLHIIPGARFFVQYVDYHKVLMMVTEGTGYTEMGVKNTFFIAEAYAIGGMWLMAISPIIVGFSMALGLSILITFLRKFIGEELAYPIGLLLYLRAHDITGGFSVFPLLKGLILLLGQLLILWLYCILFIKIRKAMTTARLQYRLNKGFIK